MSRNNNPVAGALRELLDDDASLVHETYRHLDRRITLFAGLTISQVLQLLVSGLAGYALSKVLPVASPYNLSIAFTLAGIPASVALASAGSTFDALALLRGWVRWRRLHGLYEPGCDPARLPAGYRVIAAETHDLSTGALPAAETTSAIEDLWH